MALANAIPEEKELESGPRIRGNETLDADVLSEAVHTGRMDVFFEELRKYTATLPPTPYTEEDIPRLIKEVRAEMDAERQAAARSAER